MKDHSTTMNAPTVVITGGGTGGHLYPALAVAEELRRQRPGWNYRFFGRNTEHEKNEVENRGFPFVGFSLQGFKRKLTVSNLKAAWLAVRGFSSCWFQMRRLSRGVVFGVGGYVSAPAMVSGKLLGWPVTLHEQNTIPGLVNRLLARMSDAVFVTFEKTEEYLKGVKVMVSGLPVRPELLHNKNTNVRIPNRPLSILVLGGSQGAKALVELALSAFDRLEKNGVSHQALVQTGERNYEWAATLNRSSSTTLAPFLSNMAEAYNAADLVISRAGSGTLSEIAYWGLPSILVPYPYASENHQRVNADVFADAGAAVVADQKDLTSERLMQHIEELACDFDRRLAMSRAANSLAHEDSAQRIAGRLITIVEEGP